MDNPTPPVTRPGLPWENRAQLGFLGATMATVKGVLLEPSPAFKQMRRGGGLGEPILFAVILGTLGGLAGILWQAILTIVAPALSGAAGQSLQTALSFVILAVLMPAIVIFYLFVVAGVVHVILLMLDGGRSGFEATFRVISYSYGSTAVLQLVPILGSIAAGVWVLVASIFGLIAAHETTGSKASLAVLLPVGLCCLCLCAGIAAAVAISMQSGLK
jgi:hypothetical protein